MSAPLLLLAFFAVIMGGITAAGLVLNAKPRAAAGAGKPEEDAKQILTGTLLRVGRAVPARSSHSNRYRKQLLQAGYRQPETLTLFYGIKAAMMLGLGALLASIALVTQHDGFMALLALLAGCGAGYLLPDRLLESRIRSRGDRLRRSLPLALDLMILGLEGGQSLDSAMAETARELRDAHPDIAIEFNTILVEQIASRSRQDALRSFMRRNKEEEMKRFAQVLIDSDRFGTSLATALRSQLRYLRTRMRQSAQEQARKVGVKLVFPVFFLIFPSIILVTLGPAVIQIFSKLGTMMNP